MFKLFSCQKEKIEAGIPECIDGKIELFKNSSNAVSVQRMKQNDEFHYWFNTDARFFDGPEYILNGKCDTVCSYGRIFPSQTCLNYYENGTWEVIWKK
jgi:hypothetical protein